MEPDRLFALKGAEVLKRRRKAQKLSLILPGLGQIYEGRNLTGVSIFSIFSFPFYYWYLLNFPVNYGSLTLLISQALLYALQAYDAGRGKKRETSPCEDFCPAGVKVPSFMSLCEKGELEKAFGVFFLSSPFPFTLGELCPAPCEEKCGVLPERPLRIKEVHREMARNVLEKIEVREREPFFPKVGKRVAVVGGGVAGITVAYYLSSVGVQVDLFEREGELGGILNVIPDFKLDRKISKKEIAFVTSFKNLKIHLNREVRERPEGYDAVVLSVGAQRERKLDESLIKNFSGRVIYPLEFLKNPPHLKGKKLAVIGAGDTAFDVSRLAVRRGAEVVVIYRGESSQIRANRRELTEAIKEGVRVYTECELKGSKGRVVSFSCGSFSPDYIVPAIGFDVDRELLSRFEGDNIFVTGDAATGMTTFVEASAKAKETAYKILKKLGLKDRAWFTVDFYFPKPERSSGSNLFVASESSLCQHCGIKVKS
ncbi:NADPH-dependent glutamate synthase beta chain [Balnearium lithotrophicum]|uniref:NADPH-dependent glutamate synthase beta chain n=1 Tax=Balnearium lithotrophicum TaxID=223788 RepID=A0A521AZT7_9BACT|nr:FAD-dependent oxidoreductase [Balnearium lithotrophicum]SMO40374.1 NADPH-dependent glutamate synthase beta chain [Balnearium lithotrophicum]